MYYEHLIIVYLPGGRNKAPRTPFSLMFTLSTPGATYQRSVTPVARGVISLKP